ncbi:arylsulfatase A-like enzyme [Anseongella ginsenosidimutans]|uniref:Arylsulfatase A-like enzyme n=1 Tax=Anseongella ginsenosidimutans TaxID=496056 RepID=A0A4V2UUC0_9SPHI|nr:sulfatase-like hydrolase/transferase [Anseongella ginsenosidimutans]QEC51247.1 sulfatase-like hydrolase/transferase [Anseongella ginsenosidimutans]TCS90073.1 arylsulfatase A-like enzyme [Anseongella ginsenosidimutans]
MIKFYHKRSQQVSLVFSRVARRLVVPGCALLFVIFNSAASAQAIAGKGRPNIIFILIDDMGYADLSAFGNGPVNTPNIDRLAEEGIRFTNFYVASPICSPSRVALMTGQYPVRHGFHSYLDSREKNARRKMPDYLDPDVTTLARTMKEAGYATAHFGKWHMGGGRDVGDAPLPSEYGFDESLVSFEGLGDRLLIKGDKLSEASAKLGRGKITWVEKHEMTPIYVDRTIDFIKRHPGEPFYIDLWTNDVHDPHQPKPGHREKFNRFANNHYARDFYAVLYQLDREIGRLLDSLDAMGLRENTLVVLTSDNGPTDWHFYYKEYFQPPGSADPFRGRKWSLYEGGIRVPFLARWPAGIPSGLTDSTTVMHSTDLFLTFCRAAGLQPPAERDGRDMLPALKGSPVQRKEALFWEYGREGVNLKPGNPRFISPQLAMRKGNMKLLINADSTDIALYNLSEDQAENHNLAETQPETARKMAAELLTWKRSMP